MGHLQAVMRIELLDLVRRIANEPPVFPEG